MGSCSNSSWVWHLAFPDVLTGRAYPGHGNYLLASHLSLGALLVSKQQKEKKNKTPSDELKDEGSKENVNSINESYTIYCIYLRGRWEFSSMEFK